MATNFLKFCSMGSTNGVAFGDGVLGVDCVAGEGRIHTWSVEGDSCHGRVSGINKICFLCSSYCRSQATAA